MEKMRILIVNKFYYPRGGDCIVAMNLERLLKEAGHDVAVFAMQYPENVSSPWAGYFASEVNFSHSYTAKFKAAWRTMGWGSIRKSFTRILNDFKPDIVHLHNIHSYLSPVVAQLAKEHGCRVVWTLHDFKLVCPSYSCLLDGNPCEKCIGRSKMAVIKNRCMKSGIAGSAVAYLEARRWDRHTLSDVTDAFICPSKFMATKMRKDGFNPNKLHVVCNHIDPVKLALFNSMNSPREDYYVYVGRLSTEKGVETLLDVASKLPYTLKIAGDGPLRKQLEEQYVGSNNIEFLGHQNAQQVATLLSNARFSVMPSECYDNNPLGVIESLCAGTPVVGARIGGIPELLNENNGISFTSGNKDELSLSINKAFDNKWNFSDIKNCSIQLYAPQNHLKEILSIYTSL